MGSKMLKVMGILCIIFGAIAIVLDIIALIGVGALAAYGAPTGALIASCVIALIGAVMELVAGIMGVTNWAKPEKAMTCIILGFIIAACSVISNIITLVAYPASFSWVSIFTGLVVPVLYLIGAFQLKGQQNSGSNY